MTQLPDTKTRDGQWEASDLLCKMCGWRVTEIDRAGPTMRECWVFVPGEVKEVYQAYLLATSELRGFPDLYNPANMALTWRVVNFAAENVPHFAKWWHDIAVVTILDLPPAALSIFLCDNILRLADEAGMIEVKE